MSLIPWVALGIFILDQATKLLVLKVLDPTTPVSVIEGLLQLTLILNPGVAFGFLGNVPPSWRFLVSLLSISAILAISALALWSLPRSDRWSTLALGLVFGGAVGNLLDRWRLGGVVDFIDVYWRQYHWPAFNVADSAITVGVIILGARLFFQKSDG